MEPASGACRAIGLDLGCGHVPAQGDLVCFVAANERWTPEVRLLATSGSTEVYRAQPQCIGVALQWNVLRKSEEGLRRQLRGGFRSERLSGVGQNRHPALVAVSVRSDWVCNKY